MVKEAFEQKPQPLTRRAERLLEILRESFQRFLRTNLNEKAYYIQTSHNLKGEQHPRRAC